MRATASAALLLTLLPALSLAVPAAAQDAERTDIFQLRDVFDLEYAADPQIAPDGDGIVYVRRSGEIMTDRYASSLWMIDSAGEDHRAIVQDDGASLGAPRWSPSGDRLLFTRSADGEHELRVLSLDTRDVTTIATTAHSIQSPQWSPDGRRVAFIMFTPGEKAAPASMPSKPEGAEWAEAPIVIDHTIYRADGVGLTTPGSDHVYVVPADGGTPRQLTSGERSFSGPLAWTPDAGALIVSATPETDRDFDPIESDLFELTLASGDLKRLTDRDGPDASPTLSPDGRRIAYTGFEDRRQGYQVDALSVLDRNTGRTRVISSGLDRSVYSPRWTPDGRAVLALYDDHGVTTLARFELNGARRVLAEHLGGATLGRPYPRASFSVAETGAVATNVTSPTRPADVAIVEGDQLRRLTDLNEDVLGHKRIPDAEVFTVPSSHDGLPIQAWIVRPPDFDPDRTYPMVLEIHGGPFANYGPRFSAEMQGFAAAGYITVYANPRGSTSYGEAFGNAIHHAYPGRDYDDLITVVDHVIETEPVDRERLFVTGGSGGGVLTAWIVGNTDRFAAAVVAKPVINWVSFALTADYYPFFTQYWFPAQPWEDPQHYWDRSPLSLVGEIDTPTMLLTGEEDWRTPITESEQLYQALRLRGVPTRLVRIPGAAHSIASRPSRLAAKIASILDWFERYDPASDETASR